MKIETKVGKLANLVENTRIGYDPEAKAQFKGLSMSVLREIAKLLGLEKGTYDVRWNEGGIAVSGEATLHSESLYVQISQWAYSETSPVLYRSCKGRKDYTGGHNRYVSLETLKNINLAVAGFRGAMERYT